MARYLETVLRLGCAMAFAAVLIAGPASADIVQWTNESSGTSTGDMESGDMSGWQWAASVTLATDYAVSPTHSLKLLKPDDGNCTTYTRGPSGMGNGPRYWPIPVTPGDYTFSWDQKYTLTSGTAHVVFFRDGDTALDTYAFTGTSGNGGADFDHVSRAITIPTGATSAQIHLYLSDSGQTGWETGNGSVAWFDNFRLDPVPEPSSIMMVGIAMLGLLAYAWRKRR